MASGTDTFGSTPETDSRARALWSALADAVAALEDDRLIGLDGVPDWPNALRASDINDLRGGTNFMPGSGIFDILGMREEEDGPDQEMLEVYHPNGRNHFTVIWRIGETYPEISQKTTARVASFLRAWMDVVGARFPASVEPGDGASAAVGDHRGAPAHPADDPAQGGGVAPETTASSTAARHLPGTRIAPTASTTPRESAEHAVDTQRRASPAPDFSSLTWDGKVYRFRGGIRRAVIGALWKDLLEGGHGLSEDYLCEVSGSRAERRFRIDDLFRVKGKGGRRRKDPAIGAILHRADTGVWRLGDKVANPSAR